MPSPPAPPPPPSDAKRRKHLPSGGQQGVRPELSGSSDKMSDSILHKIQLGGLAGLLFRWRASVYKLLWREMLVFLLLYSIVSLIYRFAFKDEVKENFDKLATYAYEYTKVFPISFVLGFYVTVVFDRWWTQFKSIPWPDRVVYNVSAHILGNDEEGRIIRRTLARYVNLSAILVYRSGSKRVKKRFPTLSHLVEAGMNMIESH